MTVTDLQIAQAVYDTYNYPGGAPPKWDGLIQGGNDDVYIGVRRIGNAAIAACRGSTTFEDWIHDFIALGKTPALHPKWGPVHPGFLIGMDNAWQVFSGLLKGWDVTEWYAGGHSLGAGHCDMLVGEAKDAGLPPKRSVRFGEPRPGFTQFCKYVAGFGPSYMACDANGHDLVDDVPFTFGPEDYGHPDSLSNLIVHPAADDPWGVFRYHHMLGYLTAMTGATT